MIHKITESDIETFAINLLEKQGSTYVYGPTIAQDSETSERAFFADVLLLDRLLTEGIKEEKQNYSLVCIARSVK